ncbi:MAG: hypothetical protein NPIRA04_20690 [Nitrospirales bacterium]|nr:MAG: hypothetical protein NPIRA04_20690 [Nitrospirales bacterium]
MVIHMPTSLALTNTVHVTKRRERITEDNTPDYILLGNESGLPGILPE